MLFEDRHQARLPYSTPHMKITSIKYITSEWLWPILRGDFCKTNISDIFSVSHPFHWVLKIGKNVFLLWFKGLLIPNWIPRYIFHVTLKQHICASHKEMFRVIVASFIMTILVIEKTFHKGTIFSACHTFICWREWKKSWKTRNRPVRNFSEIPAARKTGSGSSSTGSSTCPTW